MASGDQGKELQRQGPAAWPAMDVRGLAQLYLKRQARLRKKPASIAMDERLLDKVILPWLDRLPVALVAVGDIERLHAAQWEYPVKANRAWDLLSKMFNLAEEWGLRPAGRNPVSGLPRHPEKGRHWWPRPRITCAFGWPWSRPRSRAKCCLPCPWP